MSETITSSPSASPSSTSRCVGLATPRVTRVRRARPPRTTNTLCDPSPVAKGPRSTRSALAFCSVRTNTSTRRFGRSAAFDLSSSAMLKVRTPLRIVGSTAETCPRSFSSPTSTRTGRPTATRGAFTSATVPSTRKADRSATRAIASPSRTVAPSSVRVQVTTPSCSARAVPRCRSRQASFRRLRRLAVSSARPSTSAAFEARAIARDWSSCFSSIAAWAEASSASLSSCTETRPAAWSCLFRSRAARLASRSSALLS